MMTSELRGETTMTTGDWENRDIEVRRDRPDRDRRVRQSERLARVLSVL